MTASERITKELDALLDEKTKLFELQSKKDGIIAFGTAYQSWYTRALKIVESLAPDRLAEFQTLYTGDAKRKDLNALTYALKDFVAGIGPQPDSWTQQKPYDEKNVAGIRLLNQFQILSSLRTRLDSVLADVTGSLFAELQDHELQAASSLLKVSERAAGALAGVVLERHLQRVATNHKIISRKKTPTIADMNDPLKSEGVYDVSVWRKIQYLADIRNLCSHQKEKNPTKEQVEELLAGVDGIIKTVF